MSDIDKEIATYWEQGIKGVKEASREKIPRENNFSKFLAEIEEKNIKNVSECEQLAKWLAIFTEGIQLLVHLFIAIDLAKAGEYEKKEEILVPSSLIGTACVHSISIRKLVLSGFDPSTKIVLRSLLETFNVCLACLNDSDLEFRFTQDFKKAKQLWHSKLSTQKQATILADIEYRYGIDEENIKKSKEWREEEISLLSQYVHPQYASSCFTAYSPALSKPLTIKPAIFGTATFLSIRTLSFASKAIWYFCCFGIKILMEKAMQGKDQKSPLWNIFQSDPGAYVLMGREIYSKLIINNWVSDEVSEFFLNDY